MDASKAKHIVIHCADTPPSMDIGSVEIDRWHRERGWSGIGYHFVIRRDGRIESGRPLDRDMAPGWQSAQGAHVAGHNAESIGVCLVGGRAVSGSDPTFSFEQMDSLRHLIETLVRIAPVAEVLGHRDLDKRKTCPGFHVPSWWATVRGGVA